MTRMHASFARPALSRMVPEKMHALILWMALLVAAFAPLHSARAEQRYADFVIDAHTKEVLHEEAADAPRYPASLTKMMTLYLLFEAIDRGQVKLEDRMSASREAALQPPSKLGIAAGATISVEDAIKALVTRSANDVAVVIAEHLAVTQDRFASKMTAKARELGMSRTRFVNASGLPSPLQQTTARDMATLGQALIEDYPQFYGYFQTPSIKWGRLYARNHNNLLGKVEGVDGIKTGYTRASGFNLVSSVERDGARIIAVVMGGETALARDNQMRYLIDQSFQTLQARGPNAARFASLPLERVAFGGGEPRGGQPGGATAGAIAQGSAGDEDALARAAEVIRQAEGDEGEGEAD